MGQLGVVKSSKIRFAAFAVVLLVVSGLIVSLFDEARAATIEFEDLPSLSDNSGTTTLYARITVPDGQRLPIESAMVVIENRGSETSKTITSNPTVAARATCETPITGCNAAALTNTAGGAAISRIALDNFYRASLGVGEGYILGDGYFGACPGTCDLTFEGGYGYIAGGGYGYGGVLNEGLQNLAGVTNGYGYLSGGDDLLIRFEIDISPSTLGDGNYWLNFMIDTGSSTLGGILSAPATAFTITDDSTGGGGGGGDSGGDTGGPGTTISVAASKNNNPPAGAIESFLATVKSAIKGTTIKVETGSDRIGTIELTLDSDASDASIEVSRFSTAPEGTKAPPESLKVTDFVQVKITTGGTTHTVSIAVSIPEGEAGDPGKAVLLKYNPDSETWDPQSRITLTLENGVFKGTGTSSCCSDFAVGFDEEDPEVTLSFPDGDLSGQVTLAAEASDNLQLESVAFYLGDTLLGTDTTSPYSFVLDTTQYGDGDHVLKAVATDFVGNSAEDSKTATLSNPSGTPPSADDDGADDGGPTKGGVSWGWILLALVGVIVVIAVVVAMQKKKA